MDLIGKEWMTFVKESLLLKMTKSMLFRAEMIISIIFFLPVLFTAAVFARLLKNDAIKPRLVWGSTPIINNVYWSRAMRAAGYCSETFTNGYYSGINKREDWDKLLQEKYRFIPFQLKKYLAFIESLFLYEIFFISFDGFFLGTSPLWRFEPILFQIAGKKTVLIPYGSDSYAYRRIKSTELLHGLLMSYPNLALSQKKIAAKLDIWVEKASVVFPGVMGPDGFGRWDILLPSVLFIDANKWKVSSRESYADGLNGTVYIAHTPNHRGFKGTEFVINAVERLRAEGLKAELMLLEKVQNSVVQETLEKDVDILIEQLIIGYALSAIEGMASGLPVISNLENETYFLSWRRWSCLSECPIVSASPESLVDVLRELVTRPKLRHQLGRAGREYVEKYHGLDSAQYLFGEVIEYLYGRRESLINLYHPLLGEYPKRKPRIDHPLVNNKIVQ